MTSDASARKSALKLTANLRYIKDNTSLLLFFSLVLSSELVPAEGDRRISHHQGLISPGAMQGSSVMKCLCAVTCIMIVVATVTSAAPSYPDYDSIRDLWEMFVQKQALENKFGNHQFHQVERKSGRSPSLRLRFGRRSDPSMTPEAAFLMAQDVIDREN